MIKLSITDILNEITAQKLSAGNGSDGAKIDQKAEDVKFSVMPIKYDENLSIINFKIRSLSRNIGHTVQISFTHLNAAKKEISTSKIEPQTFKLGGKYYYKHIKSGNIVPIIIVNLPKSGPHLAAVKYLDDKIEENILYENFTIRKSKLYRSEQEAKNQEHTQELVQDPLLIIKKAILSDIKVHCTCESYQYYRSYQLTQMDAAIYPEKRPPKKNDPRLERVHLCHHLLAALRYILKDINRITNYIAKNDNYLRKITGE